MNKVNRTLKDLKITGNLHLTEKEAKNTLKVIMLDIIGDNEEFTAVPGTKENDLLLISQSVRNTYRNELRKEVDKL